MFRRIIALLALSALRLFPQSSEAGLRGYFEQGEKALAEERYGDAEAAYEKLRKLAPNVAEVYGRLGLVYFQEKRFTEAVPVLRQALKLKPSLPNTDVLLGMSLSEIGRYPEALPILDKTFHKTADPALKRMSGLQLERTYTGLHRNGDAVQIALDLNRLYPNDPEILYYSGQLFGNYAFDSMQRLAEVAPDSVWRHEAAGDAYQSAGKTDLAVAEFRQVLVQAPQRFGAHYRLGRALLANSPRDAASEFEQELALDPTNSNAAYELAEVWRKAGDFDRAQPLFVSALKHNPSFEEANTGLGRTLLALGKAGEALPYLQKAVELNSRDEVPYYQLAMAYRALGRVAEQKASLARFERCKAENLTRAELLRAPSTVTRQEAQ